MKPETAGGETPRPGSRQEADDYCTALCGSHDPLLLHPEHRYPQPLP